MRADTRDYRKIFMQGRPLFDTRAPVEFARGAFPAAVNLPLMNDSEREQVGIRYKQAGQSAAIALGNELVCGAVKEARIQAWCNFAEAHPDGYLYCFRGGLRSQTSQLWMRDAGCDYPLVLGGYKAMRRFLLDQLESSIEAGRFILIAGKTGTGKTRVIDAVDSAVDLEGLAKHRGSSFGRLLDPQPSQIDFENRLSIDLLRLLAAGGPTVLLEDEGRLIGRVTLPDSLCEKMQASPLLVVDEPVEQRIQVILEDYVCDLGERYNRSWGDEGVVRHRQHLLEGLARIKKRLGDERYATIEKQMIAAFDHQVGGGDENQHRQWIETLLVDYYDPMYEYQMNKREGRVLARGSRAEIIALARESVGSEV
jgi:tRNA 2-selenouridine synthase